MHLGVISDIHGNFQALTAVLDDLTSRNVDRIVNLGDAVGYGPEPEKVVTTLINRDIPSVLGNHELALIDNGYFQMLNPVSQHSLIISRQLLTDEHLGWIGELPVALVRYDARFQHGCPPSSATQYLFTPSIARLKRIFSSYPEKICFAGHTHLISMFCCSSDGIISIDEPPIGTISLAEQCRYLFVCGSVGQPRDSLSNKAKYAIWDQTHNRLEIRAVAYDVDTTVRLLRSRGFPESNAQRLL